MCWQYTVVEKTQQHTRSQLNFYDWQNNRFFSKWPTKIVGALSLTGANEKISLIWGAQWNCRVTQRFSSPLALRGKEWDEIFMSLVPSCYYLLLFQILNSCDCFYYYCNFVLISQDVSASELLKDREILNKIDHQLTMPEKEKLSKSWTHVFSV